MLAVKVVALRDFLGAGQTAALRREALVLELAAMQDYAHPHLLAMKVRSPCPLTSPCDCPVSDAVHGRNPAWGLLQDTEKAVCMPPDCHWLLHS
jgi:hypothetical protein